MNYFIRHILVIISFLSGIIFYGCVDEMEYYSADGVDGSEVDIRLCINYEAEQSVELSTRASSVADGDAISDITSLAMLVYNQDGTLYKAYQVLGGTPSADISGVKHTKDESKLPDGTTTDTPNGRVDYNLHIRSGYYYAYAVANIPDLLSDNTGKYDYSTRDALKRIRRDWDEDVLANNSEMLGIFTVGDPDRNATDDNTIAISKKRPQLYAWARRLASKVTVGFDGTNLYNGVQVYIRDISIRDIPKNCYLGVDNHPGQKADGTEAPRSQRYEVDNGLIALGGTRYIEKDLPHSSGNGSTIIMPDNYMHVCNSQHRFLGKGDDESDEPAKLDKDHAYKAESLFFYENMQGIGKSKKQSQDGIKIDFPNPDENQEGSGWKDEKAYGTYVEVTGFYRCNSPNGYVSSGDIKFRFMLGQNAEDDYNSIRNTHYKLTLRFKGYGNDADWHIEYEENSGIYASMPVYVSYLYNKRTTVPIKIIGRIKPGTKLSAEIEDSQEGLWKPWGDGSDAFPIPPTTMYHSANDIFNDGAWNGFLALKKSNILQVEDPAYKDLGSRFTPETTKYNETHWKEKNRLVGKRDYEIGNELGDTYQEFGDDSDNAEGKYSVNFTAYDDSRTTVIERVFNIPLYTRPKNLVTKTAYTGNNVYSSHPRFCKVKFTATLWDTDKNDWVDKSITLNVIQVRRIENPKAVWRDKTSDPFHVVLTRLIAYGKEEYSKFDSDGIWSASIVSGSDPIITLSTTPEGLGPGRIPQSNVNRIEGGAQCPIDFNINFNGNEGFAVVRVRYHNLMCEHDIFVRKGIGPVALVDNGVEWQPTNIYRFDTGNEPIRTGDPREAGSFFRRGSYTAILEENDKTYPPNVENRGNLSDNSFKVLAPGKTSIDSKKWTDITPDIKVMDTTIEFPDGQTGAYDWPVKPSVSGERLASIDDFYELIAPDYTVDTWPIKQAYGVLYGDGATETQTSFAKAHGYTRSNPAPESGMRGIVVYNKNNMKQVFFPIGATGHGRRKGNGWVSEPGVLRYAGRDAANPTIYAPLFYDLYKRPGAVYWCKLCRSLPDNNPDKKYSSAFDFNYFAYGFEGFSNDALGYIGKAIQLDGTHSSACFLRTVIDPKLRNK